MEESAQQRSERYVSARSQHPAWLLLASRRAPLVLGCLRTLFERAHDGIPMEDALQALSEMLAAYASQELYEIDPDATHLQAGRELREWIKRRLVVEREGRIYATDALESAIHFVDSLDSRIMTSTASRLSVVQREIENLETGLNPSPTGRIASLRRRIQDLEHELAQVEAGHVIVLDEAQAIEGIREVYSLATSLRTDFRRVEDSWREADRALRHSIISEQSHRGEIVDRLLDGQDALLNTPEGRVFESFQQQLRQSAELEAMRDRLRTILRHPAVPKALNRPQQRELRWLALRLVRESQAVLQARARSERDVRGFMKTGLAAEHHRVGQLLNDFFNLALSVDWQRQSERRKPACLPPVGVAITGVPAIERLRFKTLDDDEADELDLSLKPAGLEQIDDDFWDAFDGLDRETLIHNTLAVLVEQNRPVSLGELAFLLPPTHDLEPSSRPVFFDDGYTRKLTFKEHPYREAVKALLADNDRHCVESPEQLRHTPHAMTAQGLMSGKERFFDKQDQKRLDEDWLTGFDNRDRLAFLTAQIREVNAQLTPAKLALDAAQSDVRKLEGQASLLQRIEELQFEEIDLPGAERQLQSLRTQLDTLTRPDSDLAMIKAELDQAETLRQLNSARFIDDEGESHYKALQALVDLLKDACEHSRNQGAKALLDPRFRLEFAVSMIDRESKSVIETRTGSQGGSGGEKEIIASYVLTASLSYALCPDGSSRPLFGTIVLDEAFSRSSHAVAGRIIAALREFGLHAVFITPNKEMRLLRHHTRSAVVVHRRGVESSLVSMSWEALDEHHQQRIKAMHEVAR